MFCKKKKQTKKSTVQQCGFSVEWWNGGGGVEWGCVCFFIIDMYFVHYKNKPLSLCSRRYRYRYGKNKGKKTGYVTLVGFVRPGCVQYAVSINSINPRTQTGCWSRCWKNVDMKMKQITKQIANTIRPNKPTTFLYEEEEAWNGKRKLMKNGQIIFLVKSETNKWGYGELTLAIAWLCHALLIRFCWVELAIYLVSTGKPGKHTKRQAKMDANVVYKMTSLSRDQQVVVDLRYYKKKERKRQQK